MFFKYIFHIPTQKIHIMLGLCRNTVICLHYKKINTPDIDAQFRCIYLFNLKMISQSAINTLNALYAI